MLALTQCWFTRTHVPAYPGRKNAEGVFRSDCRHCDRPIISWDKKAWHLAEGFNLLSVYQGMEKPFLYLIDTRNDFVVARFPIDHLETEPEVEAYMEQIKADNGVNDPESSLALRDSRKRKFRRTPLKPKQPGIEAFAVPAGPPEPLDGAAPADPRDCDKLTGLPGRGTFEAVFEAECRNAREHGLPLVIAFVDPDRMDKLNRAQGLDHGDKLITLIADELASLPGCHRHLSRNRGLEFVLLLRNADADVVAKALDQIRRTVADRKEFAVEGEGPGIACGLAQIAVDGDPRLALRAADVALHRAKAEGGNRVVKGVMEAPE
ncbi:GGDEF domain-containing protein [Novosphingobium flavum]|uniref:GGDEF domain-containing protein n=1 Tax=Novosphingobium aerophilum TaxID=2839843 RepID=UPI00163AE1AC|nr:GGDEF domain-containing protein [Novosphingobium aerophilum]MBC2662693.1 GGDEF domain-containing protein [Novosphingobium aerophilum]